MIPRERQQKTECPHCRHWDSRVVSGTTDPRGYKRYRQCLACAKRFSTIERVLRATSSNNSTDA